MKRTLTLILMFVTCLATFAQQDDPNSRRNLMVGSFSGQRSSELRKAVLEDLVGTHRFNVYEESVYRNLPKEVREKIVLHGIVSGNVKSLKTEKKTWETTASDGTKKTNSRWESEMEWSITITDPQTDKTITTKNFTNYGSHSTEREKAELDALTLGNKIISFFENQYPVTTTIVTLDDVNKNKAKSATIAVGSKSSIYRGMEFDASIRTADKWKKIGELKIKEINSETQSTCNITSGGKEIKDAFEEGLEISLTSHAIPSLLTIFTNKKIAPRLGDIKPDDNARRNILLGTVTGNSSYTQDLHTQLTEALRTSHRAAIFSQSEYNKLTDSQRAATTIHGILSGYVIDCSTTSEQLENFMKETYTLWTTKVRWVASIVNPASGEMIYLTIRTGSGSSKESGSKSVEAALKNASADIDDLLYQTFPLDGSIATLDEADKKKARTVTIDLGSKDAVYKGLTFAVFVQDATSEWENIGRLEITDIVDDGHSTCKVTKGGADIKKALEEGIPNRIVSFYEVSF